MHGVIDGDSIIYQAAWGAERKHWHAEINGHRVSPETVKSNRDVKKWVKENIPEGTDVKLASTTEVNEEYVAIGALNNAINQMVKVSGIDTWTIYLSDPNRSKRRKYTEENGITIYKHDRDNRPKPTHGRACWFHMVDHYSAVVNRDGDEADDSCSRIMYEAWRLGDLDQVMLCHIDKDLDQIPGIHYNFNTKKTYYVTLEQAIHHFYTMVLMGDKGDCVDGIKGVGPAKAKKLLAKQSFESLMVDHQLQHTARLIWTEREQNQLWTPTLIEDLYYA